MNSMDSVENRARTDLPRAEHHENNESSVLSPSSTSSSPSHEFSFTISLHSSNPNSTTETLNSSSTVDLSPADDIFFHGHLLPLHLVSRSSTNSVDGFTLPVKTDPVLDEPKKKNPLSFEQGNPPRPRATALSDSKIARKSKSFSLLGMPTWRRVVSEVRGQRDRSPSSETSKKRQSKKSLVLDDVSQLVKRYIRMARPLLFLKKNNPDVDDSKNDDVNLELEFSGQQHGSFSGNLSQRKTNKNETHVMGGRATSEHFSSAPASMRTSNTNSGPLVPTQAGDLHSSDSSTMEELQAAIQAAIAHCKKSIAAAEEGKVVKA